MKILVTNDDGIYAPGLWTLVGELNKKNEVVVVAPDREQSAVGTSVTLHHPLRVTKIKPLVSGVETYSVEGTPADSVILALTMLVKDQIDLVVSGINSGANLGNDVLISGTVGAAMQGYFYRLSAIAISIAEPDSKHLDSAAIVAARLADKLAAGVLPNRTMLNVNLPDRPLHQIGGVEVTRLAGRSYTDAIQEGHDGKRQYYWVARGKPLWNEEEGTDVWAIRRGKISITPLHTDITNISGFSVIEGLSLKISDFLPVPSD